MDSYSFIGVYGVLDTTPAVASVRRPFVPRGARTHIAFTTKTRAPNAPSLGEAHPLRGSHDADSDAHSANTALALAGLIATHASDSTRLTRYTAMGSANGDADNNDNNHIGTKRATHGVESDGGARFWESSPLPSGERICCIRFAEDTINALRCVSESEAARFATPRILLADVVGNVYSATLPDVSVHQTPTTEPPTKRTRPETNGKGSLWHLIVPSKAPNEAMANTFSSLGDRGWCGLVHALSSRTELLCAREFFYDVRLIDESVGAVVREYGTTHAPTGMATCSALPHALVLAEGPLATLYDTRCAGAVLASSSSNVWGAMDHAEATVAGDHKSKRKAEPTLVTSRLTNPSATVVDVCGTCNEFEVVLAAGRCVSVHDVRKWNSVSVTTNVLKYEIGAIAPFASGRAVVASGIDAEVRIVPLTNAAATAAMELRATKNDTEESTAGASSFRNRIDSVVSCQSTWHGGWAPSFDEITATGLSADHEIFIAHKKE